MSDREAAELAAERAWLEAEVVRVRAETAEIEAETRSLRAMVRATAPDGRDPRLTAIDLLPLDVRDAGSGWGRDWSGALAKAKGWRDGFRRMAPETLMAGLVAIPAAHARGLDPEHLGMFARLIRAELRRRGHADDATAPEPPA